ncbi:MAG: glycoside hydrolase family 3 C-terminal domain-containing protein, partial [Sporomusaceae bacterium]|nr:glycoside hydrolase family 3 C-terminal domain-containing protein [Sporomusaceae bacterium]
ELEIQPFRENFSATDMVMAAHIAFPKLDDTKVISKKDGQQVFLPASLSHKILTDLLREGFGYDGVIITDALDMKAITEHFGPEKAVVGAIQAGADILLMPSDLPKSYAGVIEAIRTGVISEERINQSVKRILRLKRQWITPPNVPRSMLLVAAQSTVGSKEHKAQERKLAYEAVTLLKNEECTLPLTAKGDSKIVVAAPRQEIMNVMGEAVLTHMKASGYQDVKSTAISYENIGEMTTAQKKMIDESDTIILATYSFALASRTPEQTAADGFAAALTQYADLAKKKVIVISMGTTYDILYLQGAKAYLAVYGPNSANIQAGMAAVFGSLNPSGRLPVPIQDQGNILFEIGYGLNY